MMKSLFVRLLAIFLIFAFTMIYMGYSITNPSSALASEEVMPKVLIIITILTIFIAVFLLNIKTKKYSINMAEQEIPEKFNEMYVSLNQSYIFELEQSRKKVRIRTIIANVLLSIFLLAYMVSDFKGNLFSPEIDSAISIAGIITIPIYLIVLVKNYKYKQNYEKMYKNNVLKEFIKLINEKIIYKPEDILNAYSLQKEYVEATFDNKDFNRFSADDYLEGYLDETTFIKMIDIDVKKVTGSGKNRNVEEIFTGLYATTISDKNIKSYVRITRDKKDFFGGQDRIQMDSQEFEEIFNVYSDDRILATRLLTADIMQMLIEFYNKYKLMFEIVIKKDNIYLRFNTGPMFEPKIFGNSMDKELLYVYYCILEFILQLTKQVNKTVKEIDV